MTSSAIPTAAAPSNPAERHDATSGGRFALIVVALLWPAQLLSLIGMLTGNAQASIAVHFHTTQISWFILSTALVGTLVTPFAVKAADLFGKRQVMIVITAIGLAGDIVAAIAPSYGVLLAGRAVAGFYAPIGALAYATLREVFPPKQATTGSSIVGSGIALVAIGGPFLTGWLLDGYGFRGVLWSMVCATAISLLLLVLVVPETTFRDSAARMDWIGGLLLGGGLTALAYGIGEGSSWGWSSPSTLGFIIGGIAGVIAFAFSQRVVPHPIVHMSMLARRPVWTVILTTSLIGGAVFGAAIITQLLALYPKIVVPYPIPGGHGATVMVHLSDGLGMSATHLAVIGLPASVTIIALGIAGGLAVRKFDARIPLVLGGLISGVGFLLQGQYHYSNAELIGTGIVYALGFGMVVSSIPVAVIRAVRPEEQALGNGLQAMGMGIVTTLVTALSYVILAHHGKVLQGTELYLDQGYKNAFHFGAAVAIAGALAGLLIPKLTPSEDAA